LSSLGHRFGDEAVFEAVPLVDAPVDADVFPLLSFVRQVISSIQRAIAGRVCNNLCLAASLPLALASREEREQGENQNKLD